MAKNKDPMDGMDDFDDGFDFSLSALSFVTFSF